MIKTGHDVLSLSLSLLLYLLLCFLIFAADLENRSSVAPREIRKEDTAGMSESATAFRSSGASGAAVPRRVGIARDAASDIIRIAARQMKGVVPGP